MKKVYRCMLCFAISLIVIASAIPLTGAVSDKAVQTQVIPEQEIDTYSEYLESVGGSQPNGTKTIAADFIEQNVASSAKWHNNYNNSGRGAVVIDDDKQAEYRFHISEPGWYCIEVDYMSAAAGSGNIEQEFQIDGKQPFGQGVVLLSYPRRYVQENKFETNIVGNERKPKTTEVFEWATYAVSDASGYVSVPYKFMFTEGTHVLTLKGSRGSLAVSSVRICPPDCTPTYRDYLELHRKSGAQEIKSGAQVLEAEKIAYKTHQTIFPGTDKTSPSTSPQSAASLLLNVIGGENFQNIGEQIAWNVTVKQSGFYKIGFRFKQNLSDGIFTSRRLLVDGALPFKEANALRFHYNSAWQNGWIGGDEPYLIYLEAGKPHTIALEVTMGDLAEMIGTVKSALTEMNSIYHSIISITGASPDKYRDYGFEKLIPDKIEQMKQLAQRLQKTANNIDNAAGKGGSYTSVIKKIVFELEQMSEKPRTIAKFLEQFKSNLGSLGTWLLNAQKQPLQLDKMYIGSGDTVLSKAESGFFSRFWFGVQNFCYSFVTDYASIGASDGNSYHDSIKIWIQTGRDQAEILRNLIDTGFATESRTNVNLELVATGSLLVSVLSGNAPDVCLNNPITEPINYAVRGAAADLTKFDGFADVAKRFHKSALAPYTFREKTYALPETFSFYMFFYRTDIFKELGLKEPKTWQDLLDLILELQSENLTMGIPHDLNAYAMMLYQNGGSLYKKDGEKTDIGSNEGLNSFIELTELFTLYNLPPAFDFANRFRSGEMPCGIQDYTMYNQMIAFAPEIQGNWKMIPVPGKLDQDGKINHVSVGTGTAAMILNTTKNPEKSWEFLKWYLRSDTQSTFAVEMESLLGPAAKYATANMDALTKMTWSREEYQNLLKQMNTVMAVPQVPGGYYLQRILNFAFNRVYNNSGEQTMSENPVEVLTEYIPELNQELDRKRKELLGE